MGLLFNRKPTPTATPVKMQQCGTCEGKGQLASYRNGKPVKKSCPDCQGSGYKKWY